MCLFYKSLNEYGQRQCQYSLGRSLPMCFWLFLWVAQLFLDGIYVVDVVFVCLMAFVVFFMDGQNVDSEEKHLFRMHRFILEQSTHSCVLRTNTLSVFQWNDILR